jgi:PglZ domain
MSPDSLQNWLCQEIQNLLDRKGAEPAFIVWCDPERVWRDLLVVAAQSGGFELWADDAHELLLRERFQNAPAARRVIWLPVGREGITYFKVFELRATEVIAWSLPEALSKYGVDIPPENLAELNTLLAAHAKEWFGRPLSAWKELTPGNAKGALMDDDLILEILATPGRSFEGLISENRFSLFTRRLVEDFGLPVPGQQDPDGWRVQALSVLLCTDAAAKCPGSAPGEQKRIVPAGAQRERALKLLGRWQKQVDLVESFERLAPKADGLTSLAYWARSLPNPPPPLASPTAERALFERSVEQVASVENFEELAKTLESAIGFYRRHEEGFWGKRAKNQVRWRHLAKLGAAAAILLQEYRVEAGWKAAAAAVGWFVQRGWEVDQHGEILFRDDPDLPGGLAGVLARIRKAYLRHVDATNSAFSELLSHSSIDALSLPFAGEAIKEAVANATAKEPLAVVVLDACRFDLGCRLAELLNEGEPTKRATVSAGRAPLPSITAIGMPVCLPGISSQLKVGLEGREWQVMIEGFDGNLARAEQRREWLKSALKLKDRAAKLTVDEIADASATDWLHARTLGRLVFVFGDELDDHDCVLKPFGLDQTLERYATVIRKLRSGGYNQVMVVTDHGFYHWEPAPDEKEVARPSGEILVESRRAMVGHELEHPSALRFRVTGSELETSIPRSVNCFKTYGRIGFFHGGATLQELVTPVVVVRWPKKAKKTDVVLKPLSEITSLTQRVEIAPGSGERDLLGAVDENLLGRKVLVKVLTPATGKAVFKAKGAVIVEPGGDTQTVELERVENAEARRGDTLELQAVDADDEEILDRRTVRLQVDFDEWF